MFTFSLVSEIERNNINSLQLPQSVATHHQDLIDSDEVKCYYCNDLVPQYTLRQHVSIQHGDTMPFTCHICGKGYHSQRGLGHHIDGHNRKRFVCLLCSKTFSQKGHMKYHLKTIHGSNQCRYCDQIFKLGFEYEQHGLKCIPYHYPQKGGGELLRREYGNPVD